MVCYTCHNEYDKCFEVTMGDSVYQFDCFECAIHALSPSCANCGCRIVGHGVDVDDIFYCCRHCAAESGALSMQDA